MKVFMLHPAKLGGVIQSDYKWRKWLLGIKRKTDSKGDQR
jgi:helix-turn-helix protein